jgi:NADPH2:quinone reductase
MTRSVRIHRHGGPDVLSLEDVEVGAPAAGEVRLRQTAIGLNFVDTYQRSGLYPQSLPFVGGNEAVGVVDAIGEGVTGFSVGDRVGYVGVSGAYAQERLIAAERLFTLPENIEDKIAASIMLKALTAYFLLFKTWPLKSGETILWHAAGGGVGLIACSWAKALGAHVIGTAGSPEKMAAARAAGCDAVINYREEDFATRVEELTGGHGVDVVYDSVGKDTFEASLDCLKPRGLMVSFGNASGPVAIPDLGILARKGSLFLTRPTLGSYFTTGEEIRAAAAEVFKAFGEKVFHAGLRQEWALDDIALAHKALEARETIGSSVILP